MPTLTRRLQLTDTISSICRVHLPAPRRESQPSPSR
jgi:hypothetical protein